MSSAHKFLRYTRLTHLYLGVFIAPALLFFAFTGALQTFSLHETTRGSSYKPPAWAVTLGQLHKKQTTVVPTRRTPPPDRPSDRQADKPVSDRPAGKSQSATQAVPDAAPKPSEPPVQKHNPLPLKIFFLIVAIGLFISTITGIYMSYKYIRNRLLITALLIAGIVIPIALTVL